VIGMSEYFGKYLKQLLSDKEPDYENNIGGALDAWYDIEEPKLITKAVKTTAYWLTRGNKIIAIKDMKTSHIKNCINIIKKRKHWRRQYLTPLEIELEMREELNG